MSKNKRNVKIKKISNVRASGNNNTVDIRKLRELKINDETKIRANIYNYKDKNLSKNNKIFIFLICLALVVVSVVYIIINIDNWKNELIYTLLGVVISILIALIGLS